MAESFGITRFTGLGLKAINLKCFGNPQGFDTIKPINIIIGRNNTGKSTLIDLVQAAVNPDESRNLSGHRGQPPRGILTISMDSEMINLTCDKSIAFERGLSFNAFAMKYLQGRNLKKSLFGGDDPSFISEICNEVSKEGNNLNSHVRKVLEHLYPKVGNPFAQHTFSRLLADRDIKPEAVGPPSEAMQALMPNGDNATRLITRYLQQNNLDRAIVENQITDELNAIFQPDAKFERIVPQVGQDGMFEIYLDEAKKGLVPMSRTGSGIKTVILVLLNLYLVPDILRRKPPQQKARLSEFMFGFEELENNLHPSLQRRLFLYLRNLAVMEGCKLFLTTHSHVVIDLFSRDEQAQIIHVTHDGECAKATHVATYINHRSIFDDLEVRASDLLQTNSVIWVEGPSDRIYVNKWIELWTGGELKEHVDYEVVFTGGTLLAHYSFDDPVEEEERIEALRINGNAIVLIDSDKIRDDSEKLKARAERVAGEVLEMGGVAWITAGKEVENYIPNPVLDHLLAKQGIKPENQFANMFELIKSHKGGDFSSRKVDLAERACNLLTRGMIQNHLDLAERLDEVCGKIRAWNNRPCS